MVAPHILQCSCLQERTQLRHGYSVLSQFCTTQCFRSTLGEKALWMAVNLLTAILLLSKRNAVVIDDESIKVEIGEKIDKDDEAKRLEQD